MLRDADIAGPRSAAGSDAEARVLDIVAEMTGIERADVSRSSALAAALDSLTLAAVVARIEAAFGIVLSGEETLALLTARDLSELCRLVARKIGRESESR